MKNNYKIGFLNQSTGRLFKDLVEDLNNDYFPSVLYTGNDPGELYNLKSKKTAQAVGSTSEKQILSHIM